MGGGAVCLPGGAVVQPPGVGGGLPVPAGLRDRLRRLRHPAAGGGGAAGLRPHPGEHDRRRAAPLRPVPDRHHHDRKPHQYPPAGDPHRQEAPDDRPDPGGGPSGVPGGGGVRLWRGGGPGGQSVPGVVRRLCGGRGAGQRHRGPHGHVLYHSRRWRGHHHHLGGYLCLPEGGRVSGSRGPGPGLSGCGVRPVHLWERGRLRHCPGRLLQRV